VDFRDEERDDVLRDDVLPADVRFRELDFDFVWPLLARCLFTVRAAISFARFVLLPRFCADSLMCSY
jgi:hypothetical protein